MGVDARNVSSLNRSTERRETIDAFRRGEFPVLINCEVLTEGADIPEVSHTRTTSADNRSIASSLRDRREARICWLRWSAVAFVCHPHRVRRTVISSISWTTSRGPTACWCRLHCSASPMTSGSNPTRRINLTPSYRQVSVVKQAWLTYRARRIAPHRAATPRDIHRHRRSFQFGEQGSSPSHIVPDGLGEIRWSSDVGQRLNDAQVACGGQRFILELLGEMLASQRD